MPAPFARLLLLCLTLALLARPADAEENWATWRGPHGDGHAHEQGLPVEWDQSDVAWTAPLPGEGQSSPTIWGERIFLTAALERGAERVVLCVNRSDGQILWQKTAWTGRPEAIHKMNSWATPTCVTDGERVYAFFGDGGGLHCYSVDGELLWTKDLGRFDEGGWGTAASPILYKNLVIQNCDSDNNAYLIALDKVSGEQVWKTDREDYRGWSTPLVIDVDGHKELVLNGHTGVRAYDPDSGKELWFCAAGNGRGEATVTPGPDGLLYAIAGRPGKQNNVDILAVRPGGSGDVTATHKAWDASRRGGRDLPSPVVMGGQILASNMVGILTCYDAKTGKEDWKVRLGGNYSASPVAWAGLAFFLSEDGRTVAVKPGEKFEPVAENLLNADAEEIFRASITPSDGQIFIRSNTKLYCIGQRKSAAK